MYDWCSTANFSIVSPLDIYRKIQLFIIKINSIIIVLRMHLILSSSHVIYFSIVIQGVFPLQNSRHCYVVWTLLLDVTHLKAI